MANFAASTDDVDTLTKFAQSLDANYPMLSDSDKQVARAYGVVGTVMPWASRWTFYIGADGKILFIDKNVNPGTAGPDMLARLTALGIGKPR